MEAKSEWLGLGAFSVNIEDTACGISKAIILSYAPNFLLEFSVSHF